MTIEELNKLPVYESYACTPRAKQAEVSNRLVYRLLKAMDVCKMGTEPDGKHVVIRREYGSFYAHDEYTIISNPINLNPEHIALFCSRNGLHFGFSVWKDHITIYTD